MGNMSFVNAAIEKKLAELHCSYIGKVVWTDGATATVQPLGLIKDTNTGETMKQAVVTNVPIACRFKLEAKEIPFTDENGESIMLPVAVPTPIAKDDLVVCLCADRNIAAARRGSNELPPAGRHSISDSIIIGIL